MIWESRLKKAIEDKDWQGVNLSQGRVDVLKWVLNEENNDNNETNPQRRESKGNRSLQQP